MLVKTNNLRIKRYSLQFLPIELENISNQKKIQFKGKLLKSSYIIDIIHNLILKYYFRKENIFNISSTILKSKYGHLYNYYMDFLIDNQFLFMIRNYQKGKNARVYKLNENLINKNICRYNNNDKILLKKQQSLQSLEKSSNNLIDSKIKTKLIDDLYHINIDYSKSIFYLDTIIDNDIYNKNKYSVDSIKHRHIFYHFDDYGRFHTNFTILKSHIRKNFLLIDNQNTYEKDIPNSQPLFLYKLMCDNFKTLINLEELNLFGKITLSGNFYQYIIDNCTIYECKKDAKKMIYKVFFGRNYRNSEHDDNFRKLFPTIHRFIISYKKEYNNYKFLSYELQKMESNFIFNNIIDYIYSNYPYIKVVTIHDSIIVSDEYRDIIDSIFDKKMKSEFRS